MITAATDHTLAELLMLTAEQAKWPKFRLANTKTAIKMLAEGLGKTDPSQCKACDYTKPVEELIQDLNRALLGKGPAVVRNMRNYLRTFLKTATELGLFTPTLGLTSQMTAKAATRAMGNPRSREKSNAYRKMLAQWPGSLQAWWAQWNAERATKLRAVTRKRCQEALESYLGFLQDRAQVSSDLYLPENFREFIKWHGTRCYSREVFTITAKWVLHTLSVGAPSKEVAGTLREIRNDFNPAPRLHDKEHEVEELSLRDLEMVGRTLLAEARQPVTTKSKKTGEPSSRIRLHRANAFRDALILLLLVRVPFRQRCIREMRDGQNLSKDREGRWVIRFRGEELKVAMRGTEENRWRVMFPADLSPLLEEYLREIRPVLTSGQATTIVFPNSLGRPLTPKKLHLKLARRVYQYLKKHFYPHLIRTMWATEMASSNTDIRAVAFMMNDKIETILQKYYSHSGKGLQEKAEHRLNQILGVKGATTNAIGVA